MNIITLQAGPLTPQTGKSVSPEAKNEVFPKTATLQTPVY